jgi:hypothetical protein
MTNYRDETPLEHDVPVADAEEQHQPVEVEPEEAGLDPDYIAEHLEGEANPPDVIDQAIIVPMPDDDRD